MVHDTVEPLCSEAQQAIGWVTSPVTFANLSVTRMG